MKPLTCAPSYVTLKKRCVTLKKSKKKPKYHDTHLWVSIAECNGTHFCIKCGIGLYETNRSYEYALYPSLAEDQSLRKVLFLSLQQKIEPSLLPISCDQMILLEALE